MPDSTISFDFATRSVIRDRETRCLPYKTWQVLTALRESPDQIVSRAELIDRIWSGNHLVGEKGLNQAVWGIRQVLIDNARAPRYLETIPRVGYRWVYREAPAKPALTQASNPVRSIQMVSSIMVLMVAVLAYYWQITIDDLPAPSADELIGAQLVGDDRRLVVELVEGCRRILVADEDMRFGASQLSQDGQRVLVEVIQAEQCRMVEYDMLTNERREFATCLSPVQFS